MMRQVAGAFAEYEKTRLVAKKLAAARTPKREDVGKCEGRRARLRRLEELAKKPDRDEVRDTLPGGRSGPAGGFSNGQAVKASAPKDGRAKVCSQD